MNQVILSGRLVYEPEVKETTTGKKYISTRIAVGRNDKNKSTDFFNIKAWDSTAEFIGKYFHKGDPIEVTGRLRTDSRDRDDGSKVVDTYVSITEVGFVLSRKTEAEKAPTAPSREIPMPKKEEPLPSGALPFEV